MLRIRRAAAGKEGFTLLEVLIAIAIFAIAVSVVYALYAAILSTVQNAGDRISQNERVQIAFERMSRDLTGLYHGKEGYLLGRDAANASDEPILELVSTAHLSFDPTAPPTALTIIRYYMLERGGDGRFSLLRSDSPLMPGAQDDQPGPEAKRFVLCEGLREIKLRYYDREDRDAAEWERIAENGEEIDDADRFPARVSIELVFPAGPEDGDKTETYAAAVMLRPAIIQFAEGGGVL